ncbi:MAG: SH3 domain-containing protein [Sphingopyxis sp.]
MTETPPSSIPPRVQFSLAGRSRAYDPTRQAIRSDLADAAEAEHHFSPHYAAPAAWVTLCETALRASNDSGAETRAMLGAGAAFALLDLTGDWGWGYAIDGHIVGFVARADIAPAATQ